MARYVLMNKNTPVQDFCTQRDEFGDIEIVAGKQYAPKMPLGFVNLQAFLEGRMAPRHRKHIKEILERFQREDLEGFFRVSHATSLNDTYWVRSEAESLAWENVSLYTGIFPAPRRSPLPRNSGQTAALPNAGFVMQTASGSTRQEATPLKWNPYRNILQVSWLWPSARTPSTMT